MSVFKPIGARSAANSAVHSAASSINIGERNCRREVCLMPIEFTLNGKAQRVNVAPNMPLLWVLRDTLGMTGTKFGCGMALCGACTVHINGEAVRSCVTPVSNVAGKQVVTIEGLSEDRSHPVQRAWIELDVPQCGYCQSGQITSAAAAPIIVSAWPFTGPRG